MQSMTNVLVCVFGVFIFSVFATIFMRALSLELFYICATLLNICAIVLNNFLEQPLTAATENIRKAIDDGKIGRRVFVDLQKAFDNVDHQILLAKLNHCGIRGVSKDWFKSYLSNQNEYVSISAFDSGLAAVKCGLSRGSVLGPQASH